MTAFTRYFDSLVAPMFKTDDMGRRLFFPAGVWSYGRVLPDKAAADAMKLKVRRIYLAFFLVALPALVVVFLVLGQPSWLALVAMSLVAGFGMNAYLFAIARKLPKTAERMSLGDAYKAQAKSLGRGWLMFFAVSMGLLAVGSLLAALFGPRLGLVGGLAGAALFGALLAVFVYQLRSLPPRTEM